MYFQCCQSSHPPIKLPDGEPVIIGRSSKTKISDKLCSRNQLQLTANYIKKYVLVKRLGSNPSQIEGIDIGRNKTDKIVPGQTLYILNMKYPHRVAYTGDSTCGNNASSSNQYALTRKRKVSSEILADGGGGSGASGSANACCQSTENAKSPRKQAVTGGWGTSKSIHWSQGLKTSMLDPTSCVYEDEEVVVIKDKYPKAKYHWLVMPRESITTTSQLRKNHLSLLKHMLTIGNQIVEQHVSDNDRRLKFRCGYHAVPSMSHLHMHVISQDFCSSALKTKKHWNSFTTEYFVNAEVIIKEVEDDGKVTSRKHTSELLKSPLLCHVCGKEQKNMPELKQHISRCT